ncbi:Carbon-nitrogen hydrolase [Penicillium cf. griseofulvum]|uniref:Carbon-nitrogen hydrolase n=1 Tax=Penicillium cf. griseofulvum TaxID=2972120 RepID=A0A9W9JNB1_9EURO|nr:Carbon-nitrogen hydrolase [Penicillium cf. griseofulvum]KAJ5443369.1 Carbon-nitrogen hydrolase [Penicillium cf. griseofulvum]KAJ5451178.1 Carbon-nitrogen hydrolase [Penicillium cf. griseofulvum]
MRIATLQFAPKLGDLKGNIEKANTLLNTGKSVSVHGKELGVGVDLLKPDILVLPELAMTGYNFPSLEAIEPYLEPAGDGPSASWARETARRLRCKVCIGYPEIEKDSENPNKITYYNSLLVVDEDGEFILNYRKSFLYYTDETWAAEGQVERGFHELEFATEGDLSSLRNPVDQGEQVVSEKKRVATSLGICMDINPYKFEAPFDKWEFATRVLDSKSQLVILSMAWLATLSREELDALKDKPDMDTFNYWLQRFWPLLQKRMEHKVDLDGGKAADSPKKIVIIFSNRSGEEPPTEVTKPPARYAGTSAIIAVTQRLTEKDAESGAHAHDEESETEDASIPFDVKILCWDMLGATEEGICFADTTADPQMVFALKKASE